MTWNSSKFEKRSNPKIKKVTCADNKTLSIESIDDVKQMVNINGSVCNVTLKDVQLIPDICVNLLSVSKIVKNNNNEVHFSKNGVKILDGNGKIIATGSLTNDMFKLNTVSNEIAYSANLNHDHLLPWHRRLAHASVSKLSVLFKVDSKKCIECITCAAKGKHAQRASNNTGHRARGLLDLIHTDVCGPMSVNSIGGSRFFVTFIDDHSRKVFVYNIKTKNEVFAKFVQFETFVETQ